MVELTNKYYLVTRPISEHLNEVLKFIEVASDITGIGSPTLKQRLVGSALQVIKTSTNKEELSNMASDLTKEGLVSTVISKDELRRAPTPKRCLALDASTKTLHLLGANGEVLATINKAQNYLIVIACHGAGKLQAKRMARRAMNTSNSLPINEILSFIYRARPFMDIYLPGIETPLRIDSARFNYNSLGEDNRQAAALNFPLILSLIKNHSKNVLIDTGFGEVQLPFLTLDSAEGEALTNQFTTYSRFVYKASARSIFASVTIGGTLSSLPLISELGGMLWGGPILFSSAGLGGASALGGAGSVLGLPGTNQTKQKSKEKTTSADPWDEGGSGYDSKTSKVNSAGLPAIPEGLGPVAQKYWGVKGFFRGFRKFTGDKRFMKSLGPPALIYPLAILTIIPLVFFQLTENWSLLSLASLPAGLGVFIHSFVLLQRKRSIENCPTSKIKTMPMGEVELQGKAIPKYFLRTPFSRTECVYYSYKLYVKVRTKNGYKNVLKEAGSSGNVPFYIDDGTGIRLIKPEGAIIRCSRTEVIRGDVLTGILGGASSFGSGDKKVVETIIPSKQLVYIIGYAHRVLMSTEAKKRGFITRLRELKNNKTELLTKHDTDGDGKISDNEWEVAKKDLQDKILVEELQADKRIDDIAIGEHPSGGLFYISDKHEEHILKSLSWRQPLFFGLALTLIGVGSYYTLHLKSIQVIVELLKI
ncbi:MAG: hypothetical protein KAT46_04940 [Deltaproteobacteria bacterium]|nr:hypothetical protein [Deltaproteobacteria bacterium]